MADDLDDTDPDVLRDRLLEQVERGDITKEQAEEAAAAHGLDPFERRPDLPRFDPKLKSHWSIPMSVAWIAWRDFGLVREQDPEFCSACVHWVYRKWTDRSDETGRPVKRAGYFLETRLAPTVGRLARLEQLLRIRGNLPSTAVMTIREAVTELWQASSKDLLTALGRDANGAVVEIPSREWVYLLLREEGGRDVLRYVDLSRPEPFTSVTHPQSDLLRLWRASGEPVTTTVPRTQVARVKEALRELFPVGTPLRLPNKKIQELLEPIFEKNSWKRPSIDSVARARGRQKQAKTQKRK
ncbi:hypothetical protein [Bradyrhizobium cytisi]|uniref:Uncharacterized protein n=1 Tax=Bradyrhizobium cytisi TaxID=515489 RepID=A0A5S4W354_9BRAD|nr:hypothetical protein [Bradyrhizobium cytisi]TYL72060.1 hypothetical protein FXB38_39225 [Bradyrhizobium cytisi]